MGKICLAVCSLRTCFKDESVQFRAIHFQDLFVLHVKSEVKCTPYESVYKCLCSFRMCFKGENASSATSCPVSSCFYMQTHTGRTQKRELGNPPRTVHSVRVSRAETKNAEIQVCVRVASHVFSGPKRKVLKSVDVCVCVCVCVCVVSHVFLGPKRKHTHGFALESFRTCF